MLHSIHIVFFYLGRYSGKVQSPTRYLIIEVRENSAYVYVIVFDSFSNFFWVQDLRAAGAQLRLYRHHCFNKAFQVWSVMLRSFLESALTYSLI